MAAPVRESPRAAMGGGGGRDALEHDVPTPGNRFRQGGRPILSPRPLRAAKETAAARFECSFRQVSVSHVTVLLGGRWCAGTWTRTTLQSRLSRRSAMETAHRTRYGSTLVSTGQNRSTKLLLRASRDLADQHSWFTMFVRFARVCGTGCGEVLGVLHRAERHADLRRDGGEPPSSIYRE